MKKKKEVTILLIDMFDRIDMQTPSNFDVILDFICKDISKVTNEDVVMSFRNWIER